MDGERRLRIVWFMLHSGYLRFFAPTVRVLADRGHEVHLAFTVMEKDAGDARLARELAASHPRITIGEAPLRARRDGWRPLAGLVRALVDLGRYAHPRYADAPALRARMARKLTEHVRTAGAIDPLTRASTLRLIRHIESHTDERLSHRLVSGLGTVERAIPTARRIDRYVREQRPDAVLVSPLVEFASTQVEYVKSARKLGIPVGVAIASWDNLTGKGMIRVLPDRVFVWNEIQVREATELHGVPAGRTVATGAPKFDEWFERRPGTTREEFARKVGLEPGRPFVLYACSSPFIARTDEVAFVRRWIEAVRERLPDVGILVRPHPQNAQQWHGAKLDVPVWPPEGAQPDEGEARADFFDSLAHAAAVVGINTSALLEAAILDRPVLAPRTPEFAGTQEGTLWFRSLRDLVRLGDFPGEHLDQLEAALASGGSDQAFVERFLRPHGLDRPAAPILADEIERLAALEPAPAPTPAASSVLRLALTPAALLASVVGGAAERIRHRPLGPPAEPA